MGRFKASEAATIGKGVEVKDSLIKNAGQGLFATRDFARGSAITLYDGEVLDWQEALKRREKKQHSHFRTISYGFNVIAGLKSATEGRGGGSFANEALERRQANNATFRKYWNPRHASFEIYLQALVNIPQGAEIYVYYGRDYWRQMGQVACKGH